VKSPRFYGCDAYVCSGLGDDDGAHTKACDIASLKVLRGMEELSLSALSMVANCDGVESASFRAVKSLADYLENLQPIISVADVYDAKPGCLVLAGPTEPRPLHAQMLGRSKRET